jgi:hypothetical protein
MQFQLKEEGVVKKGCVPPAGEAHNNIMIRKITNSMADKLFAQDGLDFLNTVKSASTEYMNEIHKMFIEKAKLNRQILVKYGIALPL